MGYPTDLLKCLRWDGEIVPFKFKTIANGVAKNVDVRKLRCAHTVLGQASENGQPRLAGVTLP